jgi:hypothetical protein
MLYLIPKKSSFEKLIFTDKQDDVKKYCESAMALIDGTTKTIYPIKCEISGIKFKISI